MTDGISYNVRVYKTSTYDGKRGKTYRVRWKVDERAWARTFPRSAQAESFRSELQAVARRGEAFHVATGEPVSWLRQRRESLTWFDFICQYVDMKWKNASAKYRADIARAMTYATPPLFAGTPPATAQEIRSAMINWGLNTKQRSGAPPEVSELLRWLSDNTRPLADLVNPSVTRAVLEAATSTLDGKRAAPDTVRKYRMLLANAMDYAIELGMLETNPVRAVKWRALTSSTTTREVDRRSVVNHRQARALLRAVEGQRPSGPRLVAFFALMYYSALRPEEAVHLRRDAVTLPPADQPEAWGELQLTTASPHIGRRWTDDGAVREVRALKHRVDGEYRLVPIPPPLVAILRRHLDTFVAAPDGRLFTGVRGGELPSVTYRRAWRAAREAALSAAERKSPLARRPYDLRHAAVSTWLNAGVAAPQVADWAGHSVDVLLKVYAKCIDGQAAIARQRIAAALAEGLASSDVSTALRQTDR